MSIVLEAALSAFFDLLFYKLSSTDLLKIFRQENVDADLKKWAMKLRKIRAVLADAEEKQMTDEFVKSWLAELQDLAYDADDILDEFATEALRRELNAEEPSTSTVVKFFNDCVGSDRDFVKQMRSKIEDIDRRLQIIVEEKKDLELRENTGRRTITKTLRPPSTSLVNESRTYGRDEDKKKIVKLLLESSDAQLSVIPIVGMGGLGKTTLAQLVYKDDEVSRHFKLKAWVCVSEDFDNLRLTKEILHSFTSESCHDNNNLDSLQGKLKDTLSGKKFLLILDDVWNENYELWTELCKPFEFGAQGSKIVVTARNDGVSSIMGTNPPYKLKQLSRDACLRVFTHHALDATDFSEYPELEKYGQKIVDRCKGAPLAAKALGGLLRTKHDPYEWEDVLNSKIWDIPEDKSSIFSILKLSYNYLPSHLKRCFAYCSLFSKGNIFQEKELVLLWMAEGLVQETKGKKPVEDLGGDYFRDLLSRSFFQQLSSNESLFVMHDLMNDLAMWAAGDLCCRLEVQLGGSKQSKISTKVRHFSYIAHSNYCIPKFDEDVHLRTFPSLPLYNQYGLTNFDVKYWLFPQLRCLMLLCLNGNLICELPSSIGDLKHLRYLNLSYTKIKSLPESTGSLYNLETLILKGCSHLTKLPEKIENLANFRHLDITNANSIIEIPVGIAKLKSLQTLSNFVVGKDKIVDLMNLESLQGTLCISHLENMLDARKVNLKGKKNLDALVMKWNDDLQDARAATDILDMLRPHGTLKALSIEGYVGAKFPTWLGDPSFSNMVDLRIERCGKCMFLPAFGQLPFLKHLVIKRVDGVRSVGPEFYGEHCKQPFRSLVKLCFEDMYEWQDWIPCRVGFEEFLCLHELFISNCNKLEGKLPHHLPSLEKLSIYSCEQLVVSIPSLSMLKEVKILRCKDVVDGFDEDVHLRTFLSLPLYNQYGLTNFDVKYCLFPQLRCLRVLSLSGNDISELPSSIGDLKHLRYLNLSYTRITILPESTSSLYNLQTLILKGCYLLTKLPEKIENLVNLRHLYITGSDSIREMPGEIAKLKSLQKLCIEDMHEWQDWIPCKVECEEFPCLRELSISKCPKLKGKFPHHLPLLEKLSIDECNQLVVSILSLPMLQELKIEGCKDVVDGFVKAERLIKICCQEVTSLSLLALEIIIDSCHSLVNIKLKSTLRTLTIKDCSVLESLEFVMDEGGVSSTSSLLMNKENLSSIGNNSASLLEHLEISKCPSLKCISTIVDLAAMLKHLQIVECPNLTSLSSRDTLPTTLKVLYVGYCPELELIVDELHKDLLLESLEISNCEKLRCLPRGLHELCHLKKITIGDCKSLISLGDLLPTNLISLGIAGCEKLEALPNNMHNLRDLSLFGANLCKQVFELGLHRLTSLTSLVIGYGIMDSFPEEEDGKTMLMLPTSLTALRFYHFPNLLFLSWKFFQNLSALEEIYIAWCPKLESLSEKCFPPSLQRFYILDCPVLKQNCEKDKGIMWSKIANIPSVITDKVE